MRIVLVGAAVIRPSTKGKKNITALMRYRSVLLIISILMATSALAEPVPVYRYKVLNTFSHDPSAFTQGLAIDKGVLYESTGLNGASSVRRVELATGKVMQSQSLAAEFFGEGLTTWRGKLIQLTWQSQLGFVYDQKTLRPLKQFRYGTEGWGLTHDGRRLILSDGTANLYFLDPENFAPLGQITVKENGVPVPWLNELEFVQGEVYANVWHTQRIARISPQTGQVTGWIDLSGLPGPMYKLGEEDVANGIAYDAQSKRLFVTGKRWPRLFEIEVLK